MSIVVTVGEPTSHVGKVGGVSASEIRGIGKSVVVVGDHFTCPLTLYQNSVIARKSKVTAILVGLLIGLENSTCQADGTKEIAIEKTEINRMEKLFKQTRTACIGRFLLDVPLESKLIYGPAKLPYRIERLMGRGPNFDELIERRKETILNEDRKLAWGKLVREDSLLGKVIDGGIPSQKIIFGVSRGAGSNYMLESFQRVGNDVYVQEVSLYRDGYEKELAELSMIAPLLTAIDDNPPHPGPGICFDGAFLKEPAQPIYEYVTLGVRLEAFRDVHFSIEMTKKDRLVVSDALEPRIRKAEAQARKSGLGKWYDRVKVFRRGDRTLGNWTGYEYLAWKPTLEDEAEAHAFAYVSQGEPSNPMLPVLDIALDTGVRGNETSGTKPSLTDEETLYLWDKLTGSIRPRPVHPANQ